MMLGLLVPVKPYADESLPGYLHRLAEANGLSGEFVIELFKSEISSGDEMDCIPGGMRARWEEIARDMASPSTRPMSLWNLRGRRFCGKCLAEKGYWHAYWDLSLVTACTKHRQRLRDTCRHCGKQLDWSGHVAAACPACGNDLRDAEGGDKADTDDLWLARELKRALEDDLDRRDQSLKHLSLAELHELAFRFGAYASRPKARKPLKVADSGSLTAASQISGCGAAMLRHWPYGFLRGLEHICKERDAGDSWKLAAALGPLYREIYDRLPGTAYQFVRDALKRFVLDHWEAPLALRHRRLGATTVVEHRWLPLDEAANRMHLNRAIVARVVEAGEVNSRNHVYESGRVATVVDTLSLGEVADALRNVMTVEQAARRLGLSKNRVVQLIDTGFLKAWGGIPRAGATWLIGQSKLVELLRPGADAPVLKEMNDEQVSFAQLFKYTGRENKAFDTIVRASLDGTVKVVGTLKTGGRLCDWIFERQAINTLLDRMAPTRASDLSIIETASLLEVKQEVAYALVRHGAIKSYVQRINGRATRLVRLIDLDAFQKKYVFGSELAIRLDRSPKSLVPYLSQFGINPAGGPTSENQPCRQYYWRRSKKLDSVFASRGLPVRGQGAGIGSDFNCAADSTT